MSKPLKPEIQQELEPSMLKYSTSTKRAVTELQKSLEWAEEEMMTARVELEKYSLKESQDPTMKVVLQRQYAFKLGLQEHLQGLLQTAMEEDKWAKQSNIEAKLSVEPDITPPCWMAVQPPMQQPQVQQQHRRAGNYPAMSWVGQVPPAL